MSLTDGGHRRVLLTGAGGFTGRFLSEELVSAGYSVAPLEWEAQGPCDLRDPAAVAARVREVGPDFVIHLAAVSFVGHASPRDFYDVNAIGTDNLLRAVAELPRRPRKVIVASSANVYGRGGGGPLAETVSIAPANHYACSKAAMEFIARTWFDELPIVLTRPFNYTGAGQPASFLVPKLVDHFARRSTEVELGNLEITRDFSDVRDVSRVYRRLLETEARSQVVNICSGRGYSIDWILATLSRLTGHSPRIVSTDALTRRSDIPVLVGDPTLLTGLVGPSTTIAFEETLGWMLAT